METNPIDKVLDRLVREQSEDRRQSLKVHLPDVGEEVLTTGKLEAAWPRLSEVARAQIIKDYGGTDAFTKVLKRNHAPTK